MSKPAKAQRQPEAAPMPATARMQELAELRRLQGVIVPRPVPLTALAVRAWLADIVAKGGQQDVDAAWYSFDNKQIKDQLYGDWQSLRAQADRAYFKLASEAEQEQAAARHAWRRKHEADRLARENAGLEAQIAKNKQRIAQLTA